MTAALTGDTKTTTEGKLESNTDITYTAAANNNPATWTKSVTLTQQQTGWVIDADKIGGIAITSIPSSGTVKVSYNGTTASFDNK